MAVFYQVGGSVRDKQLGLNSKDIDYAVEAGSFEEMHQSILDRGGEVFLSTPQYFTIRARIPELGACDFVLCRKESAYSDGRRPDVVSVGTIYDDLARRDFTINAMAIREDGSYIDPHGGLADMDIGIIRCVGKTVDRFTEDGLRMLRALRFNITLGLSLSNMIQECLKRPTFFAPRLNGVSAERIREELVKCFKHNTVLTLNKLQEYEHFRDHILLGSGVWLKPTLEAR